jgi:hypothetical protein
MQPNHQIIQEEIAVDRDDNVMLENAAGPSASSPKMNGIGTRNVMGDGAHRRILPLNGEPNFVSFASTTIYRPAAPEEHAPGGSGQGLPIFFIQHQRLGVPPAQCEMSDLLRRATHITCGATKRVHTDK